MKELTMFYLDDCGYCAKAEKALEELCSANPAYRSVPIKKIEESKNPEIAEQFDYYAVPTFYDGDTKLFEAHLFMNYEEIRDEIKKVLDYAMEP